MLGNCVASHLAVLESTSCAPRWTAILQTGETSSQIKVSTGWKSDSKHKKRKTLKKMQIYFFLYPSNTSQCPSDRRCTQQLRRLQARGKWVFNITHAKERNLSTQWRFPFGFNHVQFPLFHKVKGLTILSKSFNTMADLSRLLCGSTINPLITLCSKSEGRSERWIKIENGVHPGQALWQRFRSSSEFGHGLGIFHLFCS